MERISVTLEQTLAAREKRAARQRELIEKFGQTLLSLTAIAPGPVKRTEETVFVGETACALIAEKFGGETVFSEANDAVTGFEAMFVIKTGADAAKKTALEIENTHPLGRLMDIDVFDDAGKSVGRGQMGLESRKCILCQNSAAYCMRAKTHTPAEIAEKIKKIVADFRQKNK